MLAYADELNQFMIHWVRSDILNIEWYRHREDATYLYVLIQLFNSASDTNTWNNN